MQISISEMVIITSNSLEGLEFKKFDDIPNFGVKLSEFLDSLDEELMFWREYVETNGRRTIPHPIKGYACLDHDHIIAISYYSLPRKYGVRYFINKIFPPEEAITGCVVQKEYQRRGIARHLDDLLHELMRIRGFKRDVYFIDIDNVVMVKWTEKGGRKLIKKNDKQYYVVDELDSEK